MKTIILQVLCVPIFMTTSLAQENNAIWPQLQTVQFDWQKHMVVAKPQYDASGNLLPLQSYDETVRRGMSFLFDGHPHWFKGNKDDLTDEQGTTQMPWVYYSNLQHNGEPFPSSVDRFVSYPAFHHSLFIKTAFRLKTHKSSVTG